MSLAYVDSSWLVAIALEEAGHEKLELTLEAFDRVVSSNLLEAELRGALAREATELPPRFLEPMGWILPERPLSAEIAEALTRGTVRGADLWHLACALYCRAGAGEVAFFTLDQRQRELAIALGFST